MKEADTATEIYKKIWALSESLQNRRSYLELVGLTNELIQIFDSEGRLSEDPFARTRKRKLGLPFAEINHELQGSTCIVTGGLGCIGSTLVQKLLKFEVVKIIIIDNGKKNNLCLSSKRVISLNCDIRDTEAVNNIFLLYHPNFVFHTAAQRDPGFAEVNPHEAISTNVLGTLNIIKASELVKTVKQVIFSSTGKASRYYTEEVYAGTKKMCEFMLAGYAKKSTIKYSMARFTHILDNSLMNIDLRTKSETANYVSVHSPGKYVTAQNANEAASLMLNAVIHSETEKCNFLLVRHLEWPVESLEMALYYIKKSKRPIPVVFIGNPAGYTEKFFRGQMDWSKPEELNVLINVYEEKYRRLNQHNDIIISQACLTNECTLSRVLNRMKKVNGEKDIKQTLIRGLKDVVAESLKIVDEKVTVSILKWGLEPNFLKKDNVTASDFGDLVPMLIDSLKNSDSHKEIAVLPYQYDQTCYS